MAPSIAPMIDIQLTPDQYTAMFPERTTAILQAFLIVLILFVIVMYRAFFSMMNSIDNTLIRANKAIDAYVSAKNSN